MPWTYIKTFEESQTNNQLQKTNDRQQKQNKESTYGLSGTRAKKGGKEEKERIGELMNNSSHGFSTSESKDHH